MHDTSQKPGHPDPGYTQADWDEVSDTPELTDAEIAELRPASEVPEITALLPKRGRGRPKLADAKVNFSMRIEPALLEAYRATGDGWQVRMHDALAAALPPKPNDAHRTFADRHHGAASAARRRSENEARNTKPKSA